MADQGSEGLLSPYLRNKRMTIAIPYIHGRVLDIGCGTGKLAFFIPSDQYLGVDIDIESINLAGRWYPNHQFQDVFPPEGERFETVVALAVIEHVNNSKKFLLQLSAYLNDDPKSRIVLTSPHPITEQIHYLGSRIGLFSRAGNEEHKELFRKRDFEELASFCGLQLSRYQRFLLGLNQLVIYQKGDICL